MNFFKHHQKVIRLVLVFLLFFSLNTTFFSPEKIEATTTKIEQQFQVSPGVNYRDERLLINARKQATRVMELNLNDPFTQVRLGAPSPLTSLLSTTAYARRDSFANHQIVGAINASFFHFDNRLPAYLLANNGRIVNIGAVSPDSTGYMHVPAAFGINKEGKALVDKYELTTTATANGQTVSVTTINKATRGAGEVIIYSPTHRFDTTRANEFGYEIVVSKTNKRIDHDLSFGEELIGTVTKIRNYGDKQASQIPADGFVISGHGTSLNSFINGGLKVGDELRVKIDVEEKWRGAEFMLASGPLLVQNGIANMTIDEKSSRATERHPRTAVAVNQNGDRVFFVTVDGRLTDYSDGMTLKEFANYLVSIGAHQAINLDGGGSTTMATRFHGQSHATVANRPSAGSERTVSAVLQAVSTAPIGEPKLMKLNRSANETTVVGTTLEIKPDYVLDQYFNPLPINIAQLKVTLEGNIGRVEGNKFYPQQVGTGKLHVTYGSVKSTINVTVDKIDKITLEPANLVIGPNKTQPINIHAFDKSGKKMTINQDIVHWSVSNNVGTVNQQGVFQSGTKLGSVIITAMIGDTKGTLSVEVREKPIVLENFETITSWNAQAIRSSASLSRSKGDEPVKEGSFSAKLSYDMTVGEEGTAASYVVANHPLTIQGYPDHLGVWVYGNAKRNWLRGVIIDGTGKQHTINFTPEGGLDWYGWKYVTATVPSNLPLPLRFERIYVAEAVQTRQNKNVLYFDKLQAVYGPMYKEPYFLVSSNESVVEVKSDKTWTITYNTPLKRESVHNTTIYVIDQFGQKQATSVKLDETGTVITLQAPLAGYKSGQYYEMILTTGVQSDKNVPMAKDVTKKFKIK